MIAEALAKITLLWSEHTSYYIICMFIGLEENISQSARKIWNTLSRLKSIRGKRRKKKEWTAVIHTWFRVIGISAAKTRVEAPGESTTSRRGGSGCGRLSRCRLMHLDIFFSSALLQRHLNTLLAYLSRHFRRSTQNDSFFLFVFWIFNAVNVKLTF